jgi:hypothetical protein
MCRPENNRIEEACFCRLPSEEIRIRDLNLQIFKLMSSCFESFLPQVQLSFIIVCLQQLAFCRSWLTLFVSTVSYVFTPCLSVYLTNSGMTSLKTAFVFFVTYVDLLRCLVRGKNLTYVVSPLLKAQRLFLYIPM